MDPFLEYERSNCEFMDSCIDNIPWSNTTSSNIEAGDIDLLFTGRDREMQQLKQLYIPIPTAMDRVRPITGSLEIHAGRPLGPGGAQFSSKVRSMIPPLSCPVFQVVRRPIRIQSDEDVFVDHDQMEIVSTLFLDTQSGVWVARVFNSYPEWALMTWSRSQTAADQYENLAYKLYFSAHLGTALELQAVDYGCHYQSFRDPATEYASSGHASAMRHARSLANYPTSPRTFLPLNVSDWEENDRLQANAVADAYGTENGGAPSPPPPSPLTHSFSEDTTITPVIPDSDLELEDFVRSLLESPQPAPIIEE